MHMGYDPQGLLQEADLDRSSIDADVPWIPNEQEPPKPDCRFATIGEDPAFERYPMRSFPSDLAITANTARARWKRWSRRWPSTSIPRRASTRAAPAPPISARKRQEALAKASATPGATRSPRPISAALIAEVVGDDAVIFNEYSLMQDHCPREKPDTFYGLSAAGGLGWGFGAALGAKLAAPEKLVVATLGDGAYMFSNPMVAHWVVGRAQAADPDHHLQQQPLRRGARRDHVDVQGRRGRPGRRPLHGRPRPKPGVRDRRSRCRAATASASRSPADLPAALQRARDVVVNEKRQALLNVICPY